MKRSITTINAPAAIGPYSQAIEVNGKLYTSGQLGLDPKTGDFAGSTIEEQGKQSLNNLKAIVEAAGYKMSDVVKTTVFITDMSMFGKLNGIYAEFFGAEAPARSCVAVKELPKGGLVEIELIAEK